VFEIKSLHGVLDQRMFGSEHDKRRAEYTSHERGTPADPFLGRVSHTGIILEASDWLLGAKGPSSGEGGWPKGFLKPLDESRVRQTLMPCNRLQYLLRFFNAQSKLTLFRGLECISRRE
jgi:hypothetical protein